jgi:hypothetical protein
MYLSNDKVGVKNLLIIIATKQKVQLYTIK